MTCKQLLEWAQSPAPEKEHWKRKQKRAAVLKCADVLALSNDLVAKHWQTTVSALREVLRIPKLPPLEIGKKPHSPIEYTEILNSRAKSMGFHLVAIDGGAFIYER